MTKKEILKITNEILAEKHPILIIATGGFLSIPKNKISTIIIDKENSRSYKQQVRPYLDIRVLQKYLQKKFMQKLSMVIYFCAQRLYIDTKSVN